MDKKPPIRVVIPATSGKPIVTSKVLEDIEVTKLLDEVERLREALKTVESWTRNPREYEPSYYSINHVARTALGSEE